MNKLINKIYNLSFLTFATLIISGCGGGRGGGSLGFLGDVAGGIGGSLGGGSTGGGSFAGGSSSLASIHSPEPSSIILLTSGLIGMAIYARARLKGKGKK